MDLTAIGSIAFELMGEKRSQPYKEKGNKYYHGQRVAKLAIRLREMIFPGDSSHDEIITVAAWFHDIKNGDEDHTIEGAKLTREILTPYCSSCELDEICEIISVHDSRGEEREDFSKYIKLHQDADLLDHFGAFEIWTCFTYAPPHSQTILEACNWLKNIRPSDYQIHRDELNFETSRKIYDEKIEFQKHFTERFSVEISGGIWNEEQFR